MLNISSKKKVFLNTKVFSSKCHKSHNHVKLFDFQAEKRVKRFLNFLWEAWEQNVYFPFPSQFSLPPSLTFPLHYNHPSHTLFSKLRTENVRQKMKRQLPLFFPLSLVLLQKASHMGHSFSWFLGSLCFFLDLGLYNLEKRNFYFIIAIITFIFKICHEEIFGMLGENFIVFNKRDKIIA